MSPIVRLVRTILSSTVDDPDAFAWRITQTRSYLGAYTGAFRTGSSRGWLGR